VIKILPWPSEGRTTRPDQCFRRLRHESDELVCNRMPNFQPLRRCLHRMDIWSHVAGVALSRMVDWQIVPGQDRTLRSGQGDGVDLLKRRQKSNASASDGSGMRRRRAGVLGLAALVLCTGLGATGSRADTAAPAVAAVSQMPVLVELYTSQGCSACPPADALLSDLAQRGDVVALALHVDYWDYIGWADPFGRPLHTERQKAYAHKAGAKTIYTPQMVIDGQYLLPGNRRADVLATITRAHQAVRPVRIIALADTAAGVRQAGIEAIVPLARAAVVQLVRYRPEVSVQIEAGENRGRVAVNHHVVTDWTVIGEWSGAERLVIDLPAREQGPVVIVVQDPGPGAVLASAAFD